MTPSPSELSFIRDTLQQHTELLSECVEALAELRAAAAKRDAQREHCLATLAKHELALFGPPDAIERGVVARIAVLERNAVAVRARYNYVVTSLLSAGLTLAGGLLLAGVCWWLGWPL